jgi:hypothetical protein
MHSLYQAERWTIPEHKPRQEECEQWSYEQRDQKSHYNHDHFGAENHGQQDEPYSAQENHLNES